jgi:hypothetical protein
VKVRDYSGLDAPPIAVTVTATKQSMVDIVRRGHPVIYTPESYFKEKKRTVEADGLVAGPIEVGEGEVIVGVQVWEGAEGIYDVRAKHRRSVDSSSIVDDGEMVYAADQQKRTHAEMVGQLHHGLLTAGGNGARFNASVPSCPESVGEESAATPAVDLLSFAPRTASVAAPGSSGGGGTGDTTKGMNDVAVMRKAGQLVLGKLQNDTLTDNDLNEFLIAVKEKLKALGPPKGKARKTSVAF